MWKGICTSVNCVKQKSIYNLCFILKYLRQSLAFNFRPLSWLCALMVPFPFCAGLFLISIQVKLPFNFLQSPLNILQASVLGDGFVELLSKYVVLGRKIEVFLNDLSNIRVNGVVLCIELAKLTAKKSCCWSWPC